jgi:serine/threonine protein kinase
MGYEESTTGMFGDLRFKAPEVINGESYNFKADVWSFGIIMFEILTGCLPFDSETFKSVNVSGLDVGEIQEVSIED